ncbi:lipoate--protein ligase [Mycoplasmopsis pulmonis]|nr:lipoate--protein ligase [Mycoplasmopsis pulmonis]MDZ7293719.1 lipoate--protein ligase [Mycoplasmopsis pulmonis]VEU67824.1 Lipoate-protein ligase A [Mycoplasmopsis pulmonis]
MKIFVSKTYDPYKTLPLEELLLKDASIDDEIVYIYQHENAIILGRNQNTYEEVNADYVKEKNIDIVRRISGGGAVYQDLGNICFSFITHNNKNSYMNFLNPIIQFLKSLGLNADFKGRNDLVVNGFKVSGNAQYIYKDKMIHHGTLLFKTDFSVMASALNPSKLKIASKGIKSIKQRVANIYDLLPNKIEEDVFIQKMIKFFVEEFGAELWEIDQSRYETKLKELSSFRKSQEWLYGKNPKFDVVNQAKFDGGILTVKYSIKDGNFESLKFEGDFLSSNNTEEIAEKLIGKKYDKNTVMDLLNSVSFEEYFGLLQKEEIIALLFGDKNENFEF